MASAATQEQSYRPDLKGSASGPFNAAAPDTLDTAKVENHLNAQIALKAQSPNRGQKDFPNADEWGRRMGETSREQVANQYLLARQDGKSFGTGDAIRIIDGLPADYNKVKENTYAMEHNGLKEGNLNPATLDAQRTLDDSVSKFQWDVAHGTSGSIGKVSATLKENGILAADAVNYYELSTGRALPETMKTDLLEREKGPAPAAAAPATTAPAAPAPAP